MFVLDKIKDKKKANACTGDIYATGNDDADQRGKSYCNQSSINS